MINSMVECLSYKEEVNGSNPLSFKGFFNIKTKNHNNLKSYKNSSVNLKI